MYLEFLHVCLWQIPYLHKSRNRVNHEIMKSSLLCSVQYCILRYCGFTVMVCVVFTACRSVYSFHSLQNRVSNSTFSLLAKNARCRETCKQDRRHMTRNRRCTILKQPPAGFVIQYAELVACMEKKLLGWFVWNSLIHFTSSYPPKFPSKSSKDPTSVKVKSYWIPSWAEMAEAC